MRLAWTTDPHLNHVSLPQWEAWLAQQRSERPDALIITGDLSEADDVVFQLRRLDDAFGVPLYFVLGNHDFYHGSVPKTRRRVIECCREHQRLHYLCDVGPIEIVPGVYLVGDDGWGDGTVGDYAGSPVRLNDFRLIEDFASSDPLSWRQKLRDLGLESARRLAEKLDTIPATARAVLVATHVPPFREACWYQGKTTDDDWAPFFVCGALGDLLRQAAAARPQCQFLVLCGHTHSAGVAELAKNLTVHTGAADYGRPCVQGWIDAGQVP